MGRRGGGEGRVGKRGKVHPAKVIRDLKVTQTHPHQVHTHAHTRTHAHSFLFAAGSSKTTVHEFCMSQLTKLTGSLGADDQSALSSIIAQQIAGIDDRNADQILPILTMTQSATEIAPKIISGDAAQVSVLHVHRLARAHTHTRTHADEIGFPFGDACQN